MNSEKKNVMTIFGGHSMEYYAGCRAFGDAIGNIDREIFNVIKVGITPDGQWLLTDATTEEIKDGDAWLKRSDNRPAFITPIYGNNDLIILEGDKYTTVHIDIAFPLIAGYGGEDGRIQGLLDLAGIPYVGSGMLASACGLDKEITRMFADLCGLKQPECVILRKTDYRKDHTDLQSFIYFGYPVFVKPANGGTSVGITRACNEKELAAGIEEAFLFDDKILIEQQITGTEIKVAVMGNQQLEFGALCQLEVPEGAINDYETKQTSVSKKTIPAELDQDLAAEFIRQSEQIYKKLDCRGLARVDFFLTKDGQIYFNEINTVPGLGEHSIYSIMFEKTGVGFKEMLTKLIFTALEN